MNSSGPARGLFLLAVLVASAAPAQVSLPPTPPTTATVPAIAPSAAIKPSASAAPARNPAQVSYRDGQIEIAADNSSLNQILREIVRLTGLRITGTVADQRVFGRYGPGPLADILSDLLEGTGRNILYHQPPGSDPAELILTPREGGATPPGTVSSAVEDSVPPTPELPAPPSPPPPPLSTPAPAPGTPLTPQQVYRQLQQLQRAQQH